MEWKGKYSDFDKINWNETLIKALGYNPSLQRNIDDGLFWIDYKSLLHFFNEFYVNWNPLIFPHTSCMHRISSFQFRKWDSKSGPIKDSYNIGDNPQFKVIVNADSAPCLWILLSRHITDRNDFAVNKHSIGLNIYKNAGARVFYPGDRTLFKQGVKVNSPHFLMKVVEPVAGRHLYTLVVTQYEKLECIYYTLRVYCSHPFFFEELINVYNEKYEKQITGEWNQSNAGGCSNFVTHQTNPKFILHIEGSNTDNNFIKVQLKAPKDFAVGFSISALQNERFKQKFTDAYRKGFVVLEIENVPRGFYVIQPSTFYPNQYGPFILIVSSSCSINLTK